MKKPRYDLVGCNKEHLIVDTETGTAIARCYDIKSAATILYALSLAYDGRGDNGGHEHNE